MRAKNATGDGRTGLWDGGRLRLVLDPGGRGLYHGSGGYRVTDVSAEPTTRHGIYAGDGSLNVNVSTEGGIGKNGALNVDLEGGSFTPEPVSDPHRYWRVNITANTSSNISAINELQMYETEFGENVCTGGTADADSVFNGSTPASEGFDSNIAAGGDWASGGAAPPRWLEYDFGEGNEVDINAIGIHGRETAGVQHMATDFDVQYSDDGVDWTTKWSESSVSWSQYEYKRFVDSEWEEPEYEGSPHGAHVYWRFAVVIANNSAAGNAANIEIRAASGGGDQVTGGTPFSSSEYSGSYLDDYAFNDNTSNYWHAGSGSAYAHIGYQFAEAVECGEVSWTVRGDSTNAMPTQIMVQYSDDGTHYTTAWMISGLSWTAGETKVFTDPNYVNPEL